jgi:RimJ/RimL family protein N-acetyltransferase
MDVPTIETDRLTLRAVVMADWEPYAAMWADRRVTEFIGGEPRSRDVAWPKFGQGAGYWPLLGYGYWSIIDRDGAFVGIGGFAQHERGIAALTGFPECGWSFVPECWGRGIASEAVGAMVAWADAALGVETRCLISNGNIASVKVATRNGYVDCAVADGANIYRRAAPSVAPAHSLC